MQVEAEEGLVGVQAKPNKKQQARCWGYPRLVLGLLVLLLAFLAWAVTMTILWDAGRSSSSSFSSTGRRTGVCLRQDTLPLDFVPKIKLGTAQNALNYDYFAKEYFDKVLPPLGPRQTVAYGSPAYGTPALRAHVAEMLSDAFRAELDPDMLYGVAGVTAALDALMRILQNTDGKRNGALTAAPFWPGFRWAAEILKVNGNLITYEPSNKETMQVSKSDVEEAIEANPSARFLFFCNPHNPLGVIYDRNALEEIYSFVLSTYPDIHIISDEMYAHSVLPEHKDKYVSALALDAYVQGTEEQRQHVHVVWGFAKDFGFNGWKAGFIYSSNPQVHEAFEPENPLYKTISFVSTPVSALTDYYLVGFLSAMTGYNRKLWKEGMDRYPVKLKFSHDLVKARLDESGVSYFPHNYGAQFFWLDLTGPTQAIGGEANMTALIAANGLVLGPGLGFDAPQEGFYRLCYTCYTPDLVLQGIDILTTIVANIEATSRHLNAKHIYRDFDLEETLKESYSDYIP